MTRNKSPWQHSSRSHDKEQTVFISSRIVVDHTTRNKTRPHNKEQNLCGYEHGSRSQDEKQRVMVYSHTVVARSHDEEQTLLVINTVVGQRTRNNALLFTAAQ